MPSDSSTGTPAGGQFELLVDALRRDLHAVGVVLRHVDEDDATHGALYHAEKRGLCISWEVHTRALSNRDLPVFAHEEPGTLAAMMMTPLCDPMTQALATVLVRMGYTALLELDDFNGLTIVVTGMSE